MLLKPIFLLFSDPWEKNATVIGIIGKTHGVRTPANPASKEIRKNLKNLLSETGVTDILSPMPSIQPSGLLPDP